MENQVFHSIKKEEIFDKLKTCERGLTNAKVVERQKKYGKNVLPKTKNESLFTTILNQLLTPIILILVITGILSLIIGEVIDSIFILIVIFVDLLLGVTQERRAEKSAKKLQNILRVQVEVIRNGRNIGIEAEDLVVGDIVVLKPGDKISADLRVFSSSNLSIDESSLTGESIPVNKKNILLEEKTPMSDRINMAYAGTTVVSGRGMGVVTAIGTDTEIGKTAESIIKTKYGESPLIVRMNKFTKQIGYAVLIIAILLAILLYLQGNELTEIFFLVVALSVSSIPEGLPIALTMALSIASNRMASKNVIVKKLKYVETLGSATVIASDKTGTLTVNEQTAKCIVFPNDDIYSVSGIGYNGEGNVKSTSDHYDKEALQNLVKLGVLNNEAYLRKENNEWKYYGDSIDIAFLALGYKLDIDENIRDIIDVFAKIPYESDNKYSAVFFGEDQKEYCTVKGAVEKVLEFCDNMQVSNKTQKLDIEHIKRQALILSNKGYRVIAVASGRCKDFILKEEYKSKDIPKLTFLGLVAFIDPVRKEVKGSIKKCIDAGIKVVMITGDHPGTAANIGKEVGLIYDNAEVATGDELQDYFNRGTEEFDKYVKSKNVFARVTPVQKLEIVNSFKRQGEFVAVTGDGVNDAPAMKSANIGIAMGSGTEVAKETGNMVVVDDNFNSIVSGIEEGRTAYLNVRKVIYLLLSTAFAEVLLFFLSIIFNIDSPLLAVQILWLNLVTNSIQDIALAFEKKEKDIMKSKPRSTKESLFDKLLVQETVLSGSVITVIAFSLWYYMIKVLNIDVVYARSFILFLLVAIENVHVFNCRSEKTSAFKMSIKNNVLLVFSVLITTLLQILVSRVNVINDILCLESISTEHIVVSFLLAIPLLIVMELFKKIKQIKLNKK